MNSGLIHLFILQGEQDVLVGRVGQDPFEGQEAGIGMEGGIIHVPVLDHGEIGGFAAQQQYLSIDLDLCSEGNPSVSCWRFIDPVEVDRPVQQAVGNGFRQFLVRDPGLM